jgi:hypothetical protein
MTPPPAGSGRFCNLCGADTPARVKVSEPGWVVAECQCGATVEISEAEAVARRRAALVSGSVLPPSPPVGPPLRPIATGVERLRALAHDMWRRGVLDDEAYAAARARIG